MLQILTDSAADFEPDEMKKLNIRYVPLIVSFGDTEYQEHINLSKSNFYNLLEVESQHPRTSQASPQTVYDILETCQKQGDEAIFISLSSMLSGAFNSVNMAKNMLDYENCYVIDSRNATGGERLLVEYAARLRDEQKPVREIVSLVEQLRNRIKLYACLDTMEYLYRGGRISRGVALIGSIANIKPLIRVTENGQPGLAGKALGLIRDQRFTLKEVEQNAGACIKTD